MGAKQNVGSVLSVRSNSVQLLGGRRSVVEALEGRQMLAAQISGTVYEDMTGNGLTRDDRRAQAITVNLYHDVDNNGKLEAADGGPIASKVTKRGNYRFSKLEIGNYLVEEVLPANAVRTAPATSPVRDVDVLKNKKYGKINFAHYVDRFDEGALQNVSYVINGTTTVTTLAGNVKQGDTVEARFTLTSKQTVSLVSYKTTSPLGQPLSDQYIYDKASATLKPGTYSLKVKVPNCYFQVDFTGGRPIDRFGHAYSNITYTKQSRLIDAAVGGENANPAGTNWHTQKQDKDVVKGKNGKWHGVFYFFKDRFISKWR